MKTDARIARFGGCIRQNGVADKTEIEAHPHEAKLWMISVTSGGNASIILPAAGSRHLRAGFCLAIYNHGTVGGGTLDIIDASATPLNFLSGASKLTAGDCARVYLTGFTSEDVPSWLVVDRAAGAYAT